MIRSPVVDLTADDADDGGDNDEDDDIMEEEEDEVVAVSPVRRRRRNAARSPPRPMVDPFAGEDDFDPYGPSAPPTLYYRNVRRVLLMAADRINRNALDRGFLSNRSPVVTYVDERFLTSAARARSATSSNSRVAGEWVSESRAIAH